MSTDPADSRGRSRPRGVVVAIGLGMLLATVLASAQPAPPVTRIGMLRTQAREAPDPAADGLRQGLRELGYVEGPK